MRYCSEDAPRNGKRNVNFNKNTSENAVLNKMCKPDERAPSFIFIQYFSLILVLSLNCVRKSFVTYGLCFNVICDAKVGLHKEVQLQP